MINLIKKDLALNMNKRTLAIFIVYFFIICIASEDYLPSNNKYIIVVCTIAYILSTTAFSFDDRLKGEYIVNSLPVKKRDIVLSKYLSIILFTVIALVSTGVLGGAVACLDIFKNLNYININVVIKSLIAIALMCSINFPFYFIKGYRIGKIISFIVYFSFFTIANSLYGETSIELIGKLRSISSDGSVQLILVIVICLFILSMLISVNIYKNKEL